MKNKIKYLHLMPQGSLVYDLSLIEMINEEEVFSLSEHLFLVRSEILKEKCKRYPNVLYISDYKKNTNLIKPFINNNDYVFLHSNNLSLLDLIKLKKYLKKIIWCVWGHDLYNFKYHNPLIKTSYLKKVMKNIYYFFNDRLISRFKGIGIGFDYDEKQVRNRFGTKIKVFKTLYFSRDLKMEYFKDKNINKRKNNELKIMVGHSAYPFLNHKKILKLLSNYVDENVIVSMVLSYGMDSYKDEVIKYAKTIFGEKLEIIDVEMNLKEYIDYLKTIDIAVFDQLHQSALSNIFYLLYLNKKIFLNCDGIIAKALKNEGVKYFETNQLGEIGFSSLLSFEDNLQGVYFSKKHIDYTQIINLWEKTFEEIQSMFDCKGV